MTRLPTDDNVTDYFDRLKRRSRTRKPVDRDSLATFVELEQGVISLLRRARTPSTEVDGWPASLGGDGRGGAELTSVESAAETLAFGLGAQRDEVLEDAEQAWGYLQDAVQALGALQSRLALASRRASPLSRAEAGGAGTCLACGTDVSGAAEDRLKRGLGPCCYSAWVRAGRPELTEFKRGTAS